MSETSLVFTGDIGFDKYMAGKWDDADLLNTEVAAFLEDCDHLCVNVEGPLLAKTADEAKGPLRHSMDPAAAGFLNRIGADVWNICNNHIMDAGAEGMENTLKLAAKCGAKTLGAGMNLAEAAKPVYFDEAGGIGLIGVGYQRACREAHEDVPGCFSWSNLELIKQTIAEIKSKCRWCVVVAHAGEEFTSLPSPYTRERYRLFLEFGADAVVAHHPHVPMNYETFGKKVIFYSLGNFVFDTDYQRSQLNTERGVFVKLKFTENELDFEPFGIAIDRKLGRVVPAPLPDIFTDVSGEEYELLIPLSTKAFIENTKKQCRFLHPGEFDNATEEDWVAEFYKPLRSGRVPGETLDFQILYPLSKEADKGAWKQSKLSKVVNYIQRQIDNE